jgi:hypothetical protein
MKNYFEKVINEEQGRKFRVHCRWQAPENKLDISLPSGAWIQEPDDFGHCILSQRLKKSKISRSRRLKKLKFEEAEHI